MSTTIYVAPKSHPLTVCELAKMVQVSLAFDLPVCVLCWSENRYPLWQSRQAGWQSPRLILLNANQLGTDRQTNWAGSVHSRQKSRLHH